MFQISLSKNLAFRIVSSASLHYCCSCVWICLGSLCETRFHRSNNQTALCFHVTTFWHEPQGHLGVLGPGFLFMSKECAIRSKNRYSWADRVDFDFNM